MTTIAALFLLTGPAANGWSGRVRGVEESKARRQFDGECATRQPARVCVTRQTAAGASCQSGTDHHASFWNGERLAPAFAAQVIGQAMGRPRTRILSAHTVYGERAVRILPFIDEKL
jgi:hypothetical protein